MQTNHICFIVIVIILLFLYCIGFPSRMVALPVIRKFLEHYKKDNLSIIGFSLGPIIVIFLLYSLFCSFFDKCEICSTPLDIASIVLSICSVLITISISLQLHGHKIQTGEEFFAQLVYHINTLKRNDSIFIITPNINLGFGISKKAKRKEIRLKFANSIAYARKNGIRVIFITLQLNYQYYDTIKQTLNNNNLIINDKNDQILTIMKNTSNNNNEMLHYIYTKYFKNHSYTPEQLNNEITTLITIFDTINPNINNIYPNYNQLTNGHNNIKLCGYFSNRECLIGYYDDMHPDTEAITINTGGEKMNTPISLQIVNEFLKSKTGKTIFNDTDLA